jgi:hypothetical protein
MTIYRCDNCKKQFNRKSTYDNHLTRIKPCKYNDNINNECSFCNNTYSNITNLNKHFKICSKKLINDDNTIQIEDLKNTLEKKYEEQLNELKQLIKNKYNELEKKIILSPESNHNTDIQPSSTNITLNDNSVTNNTNIINIFSAGKEDLSRLTQEEIIKICTSGTYYPLVAAEIIHCNEKYPEFQNFMISNLRSNTGLILINDKWVTKSQDEILSTLLKVDKNHVSTLMKDLEVEDKLKIKLESTKDEIDTNECKEHMKEKIKNKLHSASKMINKNKKKLEKVIDNK